MCLSGLGKYGMGSRLLVYVYLARVGINSIKREKFPFPFLVRLQLWGRVNIGGFFSFLFLSSYN